MLGHTRDLPLATPGDQLAAGAFSVTKNPVPIRGTGSKILIVVVRYLTPLQESQTIQTLCSGLSGDLELERNVSTLIWDNSPAPQSVSELPIQVEYRHSDENVGVAGAYNYAMELAEQRGFSWLLLLDQDTNIPPGFVPAMRDYACRLEADPRIAAVAPTVLMRGWSVSPKVTSRWGGARDPAPNFQGPIFNELIIMNSGMLVRVSALRRIGGYSMDYWLDFSDRYVCHMLSKYEYGAWLAGELQLDHDVSIMAGEGATSLARFENLMAAQDAYFSEHKSALRNVVFCQRLLRSAWRERKGYPERARLLYSLAWRRLTVTKRRRLKEWRRNVTIQRADASRSTAA